MLIWLGAALIFAGLMLLVAQPLRRGEFSEARRIRRIKSTDSLEPPHPGAGFEPQANWPGIALLVAGGVAMLAAAAI